MTIYILGAGPAGMAVVDGLTKKGIEDFQVIEAGSNLGGLAQTINWEGVGKHDLGPHKLFTLDQNLMDRVKKLLPTNAWLTQEKKSSIFIKGTYLPYPPSPLSLARIYGIHSFIKMVFGFLTAKIINSKKEAQNFEEDLVKKIGYPLYSVMFKPIAQKIWGNPKDLSTKLSSGRIQIPSISELIKTTLGIRKSSNFEALEFLYPSGGLGSIWQAIYSKNNPKNFMFNAPIKSMSVQDGKISSIQIAKGEETQSIVITKDDFVISTIPLLKSYEFISKNFTNDLLSRARASVKLNDLLLVFLNADSPKLFDESWVFVPDDQIIFHRISEQASFDPGMSRDGTIICAEVMLTEDKKTKFENHEELIELCIQGINKMGKNDFIIKNSKVTVLPKSYPVYEVGFEETVSQIIEQLDSITNFRTIGRQGSYNYIGTLDAMDIGYGIVDWLEDRNNSWQSERERTSNYPVLD